MGRGRRICETAKEVAWTIWAIVVILFVIGYFIAALAGENHLQDVDGLARLLF